MQRSVSRKNTARSVRRHPVARHTPLRRCSTQTHRPKVAHSAPRRTIASSVNTGHSQLPATSFILLHPGYSSIEQGVRRLNHDGAYAADSIIVKLFSEKADVTAPPLLASLPSESSIHALSKIIQQTMPIKPAFVSFSTTDVDFARNYYPPDHPSAPYHNLHPDPTAYRNATFAAAQKGASSSSQFTGIIPFHVDLSRISPPAICQPQYNNPNGTKITNTEMLKNPVQPAFGLGHQIGAMAVVENSRRPTPEIINTQSVLKEKFSTNQEENNSSHTKQRRSPSFSTTNDSDQHELSKNPQDEVREFFSQGVLSNQNIQLKPQDTPMPRFFDPTHTRWAFHPFTPLYDLLLAQHVDCHVTFSAQQVQHNPLLSAFIAKCKASSTPDVVITHSDPPSAGMVTITYKLGSEGKSLDFTHRGDIPISFPILIGLSMALLALRVYHHYYDGDVVEGAEAMLEATDPGFQDQKRFNLLRREHELEKKLSSLTIFSSDLSVNQRFQLWKDGEMPLHNFVMGIPLDGTVPVHNVVPVVQAANGVPDITEQAPNTLDIQSSTTAEQIDTADTPPAAP